MKHPNFIIFGGPKPRNLLASVSAIIMLAAVPGWSYAADSQTEKNIVADKAPAAEGDKTGSAEAGGRALEEIVITAQKREQNLQDVGIAVTAFSGEQMRSYGVVESIDIASMTPGVHISGNIAGQNTQFAIRGVVQNDFNDSVEAPTAVYLDDGYIAIAQGQTFATFDLQRVEILKGPQGTLFGRNATGGLVHYVSNQPSFDEVEGYIDTTYGVFDSPAHANGGKVQGALGGPLSENLAARAAFSFSQHGGYLKNNYPAGAVGGSPGPGAGANLGTDNTLAGRGILVYTPTSELTFRLEANAARSRLATGPYQSKPTIGIFSDVNGSLELTNVQDVSLTESRATIGPGGVDLGTDLNNDGTFGGAGELMGRFAPGGDFFGYRDPDGKAFSFSGDFAFSNSNRTDTWGVNGRVDWDINEDITLTSISDFKSFTKLLFIDVDAAPVNQSANFAGVDATSFTQEVRLAGTTDQMTWVTGLYYLHINNRADNGLKFPVNGVVPGSPFDLATNTHMVTNSYSAFAHVQYDVSEKIDFILGGRIIQEKKDDFFQQALYFTQDSLKINQGAPLVIGPLFVNGVPTPFTAKTSNTLWAGVARVEYKPDEDMLLYASVKRGVKAGSFNSQLAGGTPVAGNFIPYKAEVLYSYEVGVKSTLMDGLARFNVNGFYYDYKDYQAFLFTGVSGVVVNADARYFGADADFTVSPMEGLDIRLSGAWIDAVVKDVPLRAGGPIIRNSRPNYTPKYQVNGMVSYQWPAFGGMMTVEADGEWSGDYFYNLRDFDADKFDSYFMANSHISWKSDEGHWEVAVRIRNLTNVKAGTQGFDLATLCGCNEIAFRNPRWFGLNLRYNL